MTHPPIFAILETRCGCTRKMIIAYPPTRIYKVPIAPDISWSPATPVEAIEIRTIIREFKLRDFDGEMAKYYEVM